MDTLFELWKSKKPLRLLVYTLLFLFILFLFGPIPVSTQSWQKPE
jgi:hypothetical protein